MEARLDEVNAAMSTYLSTSEVSRFNNHDGSGWFPVSTATARVVIEAQRVSSLTDSAFDITVSPLVNLWGFGPGACSGRVPSAEKISTLRERCGYDKLSVRLDPPAVQKHATKVQIDLSAIAKGYAVDTVAEHLRSLAVESYLVNVGGEMRAAGEKAPGVPWRAGIETPVSIGRSVYRTLRLEDRALATSGDYRNFFVSGGKRYSHTIDPRTGRPVTHALASVSVLVETCMEADALATALLVLGPEAGYHLAERLKLPVLFIVRGPQGLAPRATETMKEWIDQQTDG